MVWVSVAWIAYEMWFKVWPTQFSHIYHPGMSPITVWNIRALNQRIDRTNGVFQLKEHVRSHGKYAVHYFPLLVCMYTVSIPAEVFRWSEVRPGQSKYPSKGTCPTKWATWRLLPPTDMCIYVACIAIELFRYCHVQVTDQYNEKWQWDWITSDFWYALNFVFLVVICYLFRPSFNSTRYAYSELEGVLFSPLSLEKMTDLESDCSQGHRFRVERLL